MSSEGPAIYNFKIYRGSKFARRIQLWKKIDPDGNDEPGNLEPVNLTGYKAFAQARILPEGVLGFDLDPQVESEASGILRMDKTDEETWALTAGNYEWDILLEYSGVGDLSGIRDEPFLIGRGCVETRATHPSALP